MTDEKISQEEANSRIAAYKATIQERWESANSTICAIAELRGLGEEVALSGYSPDGEHFAFDVDHFLHRTSSDGWVEVWDEDVSVEEPLWRELAGVLLSFGRELPPRSDTPITKAEDIIEFDHDLYLFMFGVQDDDGNFLVDEQGHLTNVEGLWL